MEDGRIIKEGQMKKEGGSVKNWKTRWFVLQPNFLHYYKGRNKRELKGSVDLTLVSEVKPVTYRKKKNCFEMQTPNRDYHFITSAASEVNDWVEILTQTVADLKRTNPPPDAGTVSAPSSTPASFGGVLTAGGPSAARSSSPSSESNGQQQEARAVKVNDFESLKVIGRGSFGKVLQVRYLLTGQIFAMKVLNKKTIVDRGELPHTRAEKSILMKLDCPFLVKLHYSFQTTDKLYFVMDFVNGGELFYHLQKEKTFNVKRVQFYSAEIVLGLEYLHQQGIVYRDLKPENLLLTAEGHICMTDFGISKEGLVAKDDRTATFCGTPEYLAPEVLKGQEYGKEVDWWSLGTLIYEMLTGLPPFYSEDVQLMYSKIMKGEINFSKKVPAEARSLISMLLERDPSARLSDPDQIKAHPYFADIDWERLNAKAVKPPYVPPVRDENDTRCIDPTFLKENAALSMTEESELSSDKNIHLDGFTFVAPSAMKNGH